MRLLPLGYLAMLGCIAGLATDATSARDLTFVERVAAQEAIERVYYSHQIGATKPFEEAVPREALENKVRAYLKKSAALDRFWGTTVTGDMLHAELKRMMLGSRMPERLQEIFEALGRDEFLAEECLARPVLVDRLIRSFVSADARIQGRKREEAEALREQLVSGQLSVEADDPRRFVSDVAVSAGDAAATVAHASAVERSHFRAGDRAVVSTAEFRRRRSSAPAGIGEIGPVVEEPEEFAIRTVMSEGAATFRLATYVVRKTAWDDWWQAHQADFEEGSVAAVSTVPGGPSVNLKAPTLRCSQPDTWNNGRLDDAPDGRVSFTTVWTGSEMIIWGGLSGGGNAPDFVNTGSRYDPATDTWTSMSRAGAPSGRAGHAAAWADQEMFVWGGEAGGPGHPQYLDTGGRYDPSTDTWTPLPGTGAPPARSNPTLVWTGRVLIVWGGNTQLDYFEPGGRFDPVSNTWTALSTTHAPIGRGEQAAVWTGNRMIVWGGFEDSPLTSPAMGGRYDPVSDTWEPMSTTNAPAIRNDFAFTWSGRELIVWGGYAYGSGFSNTGGRYDPAADAWTPITTTNAPAARVFPTAVWTGDRMIVWGGQFSDGSFSGDGASYFPETDSWRPIASVNAPSPRYSHEAVWTGNLMVVWGGRQAAPLYSLGWVSTGGRYDPLSDTWTPTSIAGAPEARVNHSAVWTGSSMIVWGGQSFGKPLGSGGRYDPATDSWMPVTLQDAPSARYSHSAIWTGNQMIVWGGACGAASCGWQLGDGRRYDPNLDSWLPVSNPVFLVARSNHSAVWTGTEMIVWGGKNYTDLGDGGRYSPATDTWTAIPWRPGVARSGHTAVWTGKEMIVWGGTVYDTSYAFGGSRFNPVTGAWTDVSHVNEPHARGGHSAVWTGTEMIVWGGRFGSFNEFNTGGRYNPATDSWTPTSSTDAPTPRAEHSAVWTGKAMIIWGQGRQCSTFTCPFSSDIGARYDPSADTWTPITTVDAPQARFDQTAIWTGSLMLIWGGDGGGFPLDTGGAYVPDAFPQAPLVDAGPDQTVECAGPSGTEVGLSGSALTCGNSDSLAYTWSGPFAEGGGTVRGPSPSVTLPLGESRITLTATDDSGLSASASVVIRVVDTSPPLLTCPVSATAECAGPDGTPVSVPEAGVTDACDPHPVVTNSFTAGGADASGTYPFGTTQVVLTAADASGNHASCSFPVLVRDTTPPLISSAVSPTVLWPPNHRMVDVGATVAATDTCSTPMVVLTSVTSSEPDDAPGGGDGNTTGDIQGAQIGTPSFGFQLRAERDGAGEGRAYRVTYTAVDGSGNQASAGSIVFVPHDQGGGVEPLVIAADGGAAGTVLRWNPVPGASTYRVIRGSVGSLHDAGDFIDLGTVSCIQPASAATSTGADEDAELPPLGGAFFYLVAYDDGQDSGYGSDTAVKPRVKTGGGCE